MDKERIMTFGLEDFKTTKELLDYYDENVIVIKGKNMPESFKGSIRIDCFLIIYCFQGEISININQKDYIINKDNSAMLEYLINIEEAEINIDVYSGIIDSIILDLEANEFVVERTENQVKATKQIDNILELDELDSLIKANDMYIIEAEKTFFTTDYILDANIDNKIIFSIFFNKIITFYYTIA